MSRNREQIQLVFSTTDQHIVSISNPTVILELPRGGEEWLRFMRTDQLDPSTQARRYRSIGSRVGPRTACPTCIEPWDLYSVPEATAAENPVRHSLLLRCPDCGHYFECVPEGRSQPTLISVAEAERLFFQPGE